jgi:hypothetical protein
MTEHGEHFLPEQVDEQIEYIEHSTQQQQPESRLLHDLRLVSKEHTEMLDRVWDRLLEHMEHTQMPSTEVQHLEKRIHVMSQQPPIPVQPPKPRPRFISWSTLVAAIILAILVTGSSIAVFQYAHLQQSHSTIVSGSGKSQPISASNQTNLGATATANAQAAQATATATYIANHLIVADPLASNIHGWTVANSNGRVYSFQNGAYYIRQNGPYLAYTVMPDVTLPSSFTYNLTMQGVNWNEGNGNYSFYGMIFNYKDYGNGKVSFYMLRVNNDDSSGNMSYEFDKYDNRNTGSNASPYQQIFPSSNNTPGNGKETGYEFRGPHQANQYTVIDNNGNFTFEVNGTKIGTAKDTTLSGGGLGMGVSQRGTETAFSNLSLLSN